MIVAITQSDKIVLNGVKDKQTLLEGFLGAQMVKNLSAMQETQVQSLSWEDPLEKVMATHFSILAWKIPWTEKPGGSSPWGRKEWDTT